MDFCNECGNCDIFCFEDGGFYIEKFKLFGLINIYFCYVDCDGYVFEVDEFGGHCFCGRMCGVEVVLIVMGEDVIFSDGVIEVVFLIFGGYVL